MMAYKGSLFYNFKAFEDTLIIVIDNHLFPTSLKKEDGVIGLYNKGELIGVNILNSNRFLKLRLDGLVHNPNEPLINLVHTIIKNTLKEDVVLSESKVIVGKIDKVEASKAEVKIASSSPCYAGVLYQEELQVGDYVLLCQRGSRLDNGNMADDYLKKDEEYLIIGKEEEYLPGDASLGQDTYSLKED